MNKIVTSVLATVALAILFASVVAANVLANTSNSTSTSTKNSVKSNHIKFCEKLKDKKTRSIICPDIYSKKETTVNLYG